MTRLILLFSILFIHLIPALVFSQTPELVLPLGHSGKVNSINYSPDGKYIVTASEDKTVKIWVVQSGKLLYNLEGHTDDVYNAVFSPDGKIVNSVSRDKTIKTWDAKSGKILHSSVCPQRSFLKAVFSPDGKKIATVSYEEAEIKIWNFEKDEWKLIQKMAGHPERVFSMIYSADGNMLVSASGDNTAKIWDVKSGKLICTLSGHKYEVTNAIFSPDEKTILTASEDKTAKIWDAKNGNLLHTLEGHADRISAVSFSPDGKMVVTAATPDSIVKIWDVESGKLLHNITTHCTWINSATFSANGSRILISFGMGYSVMYDVQSEKEVFEIDGSSPAAFSPDGKNITTSSNGSVGMSSSIIDGIPKIWDAQNGNLLHRLKGHTYYIMSAAFSADGKTLLTQSYDNTVKVWDFRNGKLLHSLSGHKYYLKSSSFSPDGKSIITYDGMTAKIWNVQNGNLLFTLEENSKGFISATFSTDSKSIVMICKEGPPKLWDALTGKLISKLEGPGAITKVSFSADGKKILTASDEGMAMIWDAGSGKLLNSMDGVLDRAMQANKLESAMFSPDDRKVLTVSETSTAMAWDAQTGKLLYAIDATVTGITSSPFSPDGKKIVLDCYDETRNFCVKIFDAESGKFLHYLDGYTKDFISVPFSADSKKIITVSKRRFGIAKVWDVESGTLLHDLDWHDTTRTLNSAEFSPNGVNILATSYKANDRGYIYLYEPLEVWDVQSGKILRTINFNTGLPKDISWKDSMLVYSFNSKICLFDLKSGKEIISFIAVDDKDYVFVMPSGEYMGTPSGVKQLSWRLNNQLYGFDQWDLQYNRPDKILEQLGNPDTSLIQMYRKAYYKRLKKMKFDEGMFSPDFHMPEIVLSDNKDLSANTTEQLATIKIKAFDTKYKLDRINVWINETPVFGTDGVDLRSLKINNIEKEISLTLSQGENKIQVSCLNEKGVESLKESVSVIYQPKEEIKPKTYLVAISVSDYKNKDYNLKYATKDGRDMTKLIAAKTGAGIDTLFNAMATRENILAEKQKLLTTNVDDEVILYVSGHGLLDKNFDFYFATYDINFSNPAEKGILYDDLEGLLDGIPARKKLLLMDACHSGEVDKENIEVKDNTLALDNGTKGELKTYGYKGVKEIKESNSNLGLQNSFELMQELFSDLSRSSGAVVISAATGTGYALESPEWNNGVFTYCLLNGLKNMAADKNKDKKITVSELKDYVSDEVSKLTNGAQKPTSRRELLEYDWSVW